MIAPIAHHGQFNSLMNVSLQQPLNVFHPLARGLVSWHLTLPSLRGKQMYDITPNRYHGTLTSGDPVDDRWVVGRYGPSYDNVGTGAHIQTDLDDPYDVADKTIVTVALTASTSSGEYAIVSKGAATGAGFLLGRDGSNWLWRESGTDITSAATANQWVILAGVVSGSNSYLFIDGQQVASGSSVSPSFNPHFYAIGSKHNSDDSTDRYWTGDIATVMFYRRALSHSEVRYVSQLAKTGWGDLLNRTPRMILKSAGGGGGAAEDATAIFMGCNF